MNMQNELAIAYERLHQIVADLFRLLPNIGIGIIVLLLFLFASRGVKALVQRVSASGWHPNLAMVLGRLAQWAMAVAGRADCGDDCLSLVHACQPDQRPRHHRHRDRERVQGHF